MPMPAFALHDRHDHHYIMRMDQNREAAKFSCFFFFCMCFNSGVLLLILLVIVVVFT